MSLIFDANGPDYEIWLNVGADGTITYRAEERLSCEEAMRRFPEFADKIAAAVAFAIHGRGRRP